MVARVMLEMKKVFKILSRLLSKSLGPLTSWLMALLVTSYVLLRNCHQMLSRLSWWLILLVLSCSQNIPTSMGLKMEGLLSTYLRIFIKQELLCKFMQELPRLVLMPSPGIFLLNWVPKRSGLSELFQERLKGPKDSTD